MTVPHRTGPYRKSSFSSANQDCAEVAPMSDGGRMIRNSKCPEAGEIGFTPSEWDAFIKGVKNGEFDL